MHYLGMAGHPRRYSQLTEVGLSSQLAPAAEIHHVTWRSSPSPVSSFSCLIFWSMKKFGKKASDIPGEATTLEGTTATPPPHGNFRSGRTPVIPHGPYEYSVPGGPRLRDANGSIDRIAVR